MKKDVTWCRLWPVLALALGLAAAALRRWQLDTAFEGELRLPIPLASASVVLTCFLAASGALLLMLAVRQKVVEPPERPNQERRWDVYLPDPHDLVYPCALTAAAILSLAAAPNLFGRGRAAWQFFQASGEDVSNNGVLSMVTAAAAVLGFVGLVAAARSGFRLEKRARGGFSAALPALTGCMWLLDSCRGHAADPVLWDYVPLLLAVIAGMLFYIDYAGMSTGAARPRRLLWLAGATVVLSAVALASGEEQGDALLLISQMLSALAVLWRLPANLQNPPAGPARTQAEERLEETTHE